MAAEPSLRNPVGAIWEGRGESLEDEIAGAAVANLAVFLMEDHMGAPGQGEGRWERAVSEDGMVGHWEGSAEQMESTVSVVEHIPPALGYITPQVGKSRPGLGCIS